jgi:multicomponent Na+:H+ antiporter subunit E
MISLLHRSAVRGWRIAGFTVYFAREFVVANVMVLREVLGPRSRAAPAIIAVPLRCDRPVEIVSMGNLISLTPGTLTLEVALDPPTLYVHGMFAADPTAFVAQLHDLESRLLRAMRRPGAEPADNTLPGPAGPVAPAGR